MANLITLDEYKTAKGLQKNDQDGVIETLITNASAIIQTYIGRQLFNNGEPIDEIIGLDYDTNVVFLDQYPVREILSLEALDNSYYDSTVHFPIAPSSYLLDSKEGKLIRTGRNAYWPQGPNAIKVTYTAGSLDENGVPPELKQATIDLVTYYMKEEWKDSKSTRGATINNNTGTGNSNTGTNFPPHIQRVLDLF